MSRKRLNCNLYQTCRQIEDKGSEYYTSLCLNSTGKWSDIGSGILCAEGFYLDNTSDHICIPLCNSWLAASDTLAGNTIFVVSMISAILSIIILIVTL